MGNHRGERPKWCEHEYPFCHGECGLEFSEQKLRAAHRYWHDALNAYQDPEDFRISINSMIQELRNATFALQSQKSAINGLAEWYAGVREDLKSDPVMKWAVEARNKVVKQSDLETYSISKATLTTGYDDDLDSITAELSSWQAVSSGLLEPSKDTVFSAPAQIPTAEILRRVRKLPMPLVVRHDSSLTVERRWVVHEYPEHEVLGLLSYVYARLRRVVVAAHEQVLGLALARFPISTAGDVDWNQPETMDSLPHSGRMPCMIYTRDRRASTYRIEDGSEVTEFVNVAPRGIPEATRSELEERYGPMPSPSGEKFGTLQRHNEVRTFLSTMAKVGKQILESGEYHEWTTYFYREGHPVAARVHMAQDRQSKQAVTRHIMAVALESESDAVLQVSEAWHSPTTRTPDGGAIPPAQHPERTELLGYHFLAKSGTAASWAVHFETIEGEPPHRKVVAQDPVEQPGSEYNLFLPLEKAWGLQQVHQPGDSFFKRPRSRGRRL